MNTKSLLRKMVVMCVTGVTLSATAFSQSGNGLWQAIGSDTTFTNRIVKINWALIVLQKLITQDIFAGGNLEVAGNVNVYGKITAASIDVPGTITVTDTVIQLIGNVEVVGNIISDTAKSNVLKIGNSLIGSDETNFFNRQQLASSDGVITFIRDLGFGSPNDIKFGMGEFPPSITPISGPKANLHIHDQRSPANAVTQMLTNSVTGFEATDGFKFGISSTGNAELIQQETQNVLFYTAGSAAANIRMVILGIPGPTQGNVGIGTQTPTEKLHILDGNAMISNTGIFPGNLRGYYIQGRKAIAMPGTTSNFFTNLAVGDSAGSLITSGTQNVLMGRSAGSAITTQYNVTCFGHRAGELSGGVNNTFMGALAGKDMQQSDNTMVGTSAGIFRNWGNANTMVGAFSGAATFTAGDENVFIGAYSAYGVGNTGNRNTYIGTLAGRIAQATAAVSPGSDNIFIGYNAGRMTDPSPTAINQGNRNVFIGLNAGQYSGFATLTATDNVLLGANTALASPTLTNAIAIGANTSVTASNKMILGDNNVNVGIGLSNDIIQFGPQNKLEINAIQGTAANNDVDDNPGASGLRFRDLTSASTPVSPPPTTNVLSVDANGDVILVPGGGALFGGVCGTTPTALASDFEIPMATFNYVFTGQGLTGTNVGIGTACTPLAKLDVLQASSSINGSIGILVENQDQQSIAGGPPVIGIKSITTNPLSNQNCWKVAGWFESTPNPNCAGAVPQYAIYVPDGGGTVSIGFPYNTQPPNPLLMINSSAVSTFPFFTVGSDRTIKKDTSIFTDGLNVIRQIHPVFFKYNGKAGIDSTELHVGVFGEDMRTIAPYTTSTLKMRLDSSDAEFTDITGFNATALLYASTNAIIQLDSAVTVLQNNPVQVTANNGLTVTPSTNNVQLGGTLNQNTAINLNNTDLIFSEPITPSLGTNKVSIGSPLPWSKFSVNNVTDGGAGYFATSTLNPTGWNVGVTATAENGSPNLGGRFVANNGAYNLGLTAEATNGSYANFGIRASASSTFAGAVNHAGYFDGDVAYTGTLYQASDSILKENIAPINDAINIISQLEPETFYFKTSQYPYLNLPAGKRFGLTAQQVETVLPEMVTINMHPEEKDLNGNTISPELIYKGVNYTDLIPILIQGMKEQQQTIQSLQSAVGSLQSIVSECCSTNVKTTSSLPSTDAELASLSFGEGQGGAAILYQNIPNPFGDGTVIRYFVPANANDAYMIFYDEYGNQVASPSGRAGGAVELPHKCITAELNLSTMNLAAGIYSYSLVVNGKIIDTKKMIHTK